MDLQSFIQSGLLESYVLGQATAEERSLVERMLIQHPEARTEQAAIEQAMEGYAKAIGTPPPAWMKDRILDQIAQLPEPVAPPVPKSAIPLRAFQLIAVALLLLIAFLWNRNSGLLDESTRQKVALDNCMRSSQSKEKLFAMFQDTDTQIVRVKGVKGVQGNAMVYSNPKLQQVVLNINSVPPASRQGVYYQCWAIVGGVPTDMGMIHLETTDGWQTLPYIKGATNYAISAENKPEGNPAPTTVLMMSDEIKIKKDG